MKGPSLQKTAALSAVLHATILLLSTMIIRQTSQFYMPSPYIVSLIGSEGPQGADTQGKTDAGLETKTVAIDRDVVKDSKDAKVDRKLIEDRIAEIASKKKIERIVHLRSVVSIRGKDNQSAAKTPAQTRGSSGGTGGISEGSYLDKITGEIHRHWFFPDTADKNLLTIVSIRILRDGTISVQQPDPFEKRSGNRLFDNSALQAVTKASPVSRPPYEMELGIRFTP
ncbi:MAG: TonB C-terminal domain-containing protein [Nitrospirae bacterium]|nr:TonB C-terminal domain-containing protein [Nitrospirota bacterium]